MKQTSLKVSLADWTDIDIAEHAITVSLGIVPANIFPKATYWSNNPVGNALYEVLELLTKAEIIQRREEPDIQFRWNPSFQGDWEKPWPPLV